MHSLALFTNEKELEVVKEAVHEMVHRAIRLEGTCTGEHGVGIGKVEYLDEELGRGTVNLMETVKRTCQSTFPSSSCSPVHGVGSCADLQWIRATCSTQARSVTSCAGFCGVYPEPTVAIKRGLPS